MFENLYTTKMSMNKKKLQNRFSKICSVNAKMHKAVVAFITIVVMLSMICANVVMAVVDDKTREQYIIEVKNAETILKFKNKPFIENGDVYVPLREIIENVVTKKDGITDIKWNNGTIDVKIAYYQGESGMYRFSIGGSYMKVKHFSYNNFDDVSIDDTSVVISIRLNKSPILKESITYVTIKDINYMLFGFTNRRDENNNLYDLKYSIFDNGEDITADFEYEAQLQKELREMTNPNRTLEMFFNAFYNQEFERMKRYCTKKCVRDFFGDDYVFGMTKASIQQYGASLGENFQGANTVSFEVTVNMIPHENSIYEQNQTSATFYIVLQKQDTGRYLIDEFATGI